MDSSPNGDLFLFIYLHLLHGLQGPGRQQEHAHRKKLTNLAKCLLKTVWTGFREIRRVGHFRAGLHNPRPPMARGESNQWNSERVVSRRASPDGSIISPTHSLAKGGSHGVKDLDPFPHWLNPTISL